MNYSTLVLLIQKEFSDLHFEDARALAMNPETAQKFELLFRMRSDLAYMAEKGMLTNEIIDSVGIVGKAIISNIQKDVNRYIQGKRIALSN